MNKISFEWGIGIVEKNDRGLVSIFSWQSIQEASQGTFQAEEFFLGWFTRDCE